MIIRKHSFYSTLSSVAKKSPDVRINFDLNKNTFVLGKWDTDTSRVNLTRKRTLPVNLTHKETIYWKSKGIRRSPERARIKVHPEFAS